jgi:hypothetical protein
MKKLLMSFLYGVVTLTLLLSQDARSAQSQSVQRAWREPHTSMQTDSILVKLGTKKEFCTSFEVDGETRWTSFYQWSKVNDGTLKLVVDSRGYVDCTILQFLKLEEASSNLSLALPIVKLHLTQIDEKSGQVTENAKLWKCFLPAKIDSVKIFNQYCLPE